MKAIEYSGSSNAINTIFTGWEAKANAGYAVAKETEYRKHTAMMYHCHPVKSFVVSKITRLRPYQRFPTKRQFQIPQIAMQLSEEAKKFARQVEKDRKKAKEFIQTFGDHVNSAPQTLGKLRKNVT